MTFFNKKEEVLDIKLTPHGRYLLSIGKLKPAYYCFIDDDIMYDSAAGGFSETQNNAHKRIIDDTPKLKTIVNKCGVEENINLMESETVLLEDVRQNIHERKLNRFTSVIGKSSYISNRTPAITVNCLNSEISSSTNYYTGSINVLSGAAGTNSETLHIPQLEMVPQYSVEVDNLKFGQQTPDIVVDQIISQVYADETFFRITPEIPLLYFKETNSFNYKHNFDIEVYEMVESTGSVSPKYKRLKFRKQLSNIVGDMLVDLSEDRDSMGESIEDDLESRKYVEYYFDILVDDEIAPEDICKYKVEGEERNIYIDEDIECPDDEVERFDIYGTGVGPNDIERCE